MQSITGEEPNEEELLDRHVSRFIETLDEAHPLLLAIEKRAENSLGDKSLPEKFRDLYQLQKLTTSAIAEEWGFTNDSIYEKYWIKLIDKAISELLPFIPKHILNNPLKWVEELRPFISAVKEATIPEDSVKLFSEETGFEDDDIILHIKLPLLKSTFRLNELINVYPSGVNSVAIVEWGYHLIVELSKDLAFNWSKRAGIENRQRLFYAALPVCGDIVCESLSIYLSQSSDSKIMPEFGSEIIDDMPDFKSLLMSENMGYEEHDGKFDGLFERVGLFILSELSKKMSTEQISNIARPLWYSSCLKHIEQLAVDSWTEAVSVVQERFAQMSDDEIAEWHSSEESLKPMSLNGFADIFVKQLGEGGFSALSAPLDLEVITNNARTKLATLWGLSDAICKIKS